MTEHKGMLHTNSEQNILYTTQTKATVQLTVKFMIEKFEALMKAGKSLWSKGVSSELLPRAIWVLEVRQSGAEKLYVLLHLTGPMANDKESLEVTYHLYLVGGAEGELDSIGRESHDCYDYDNNQGCYSRPHMSKYTVDVSRDRVKKALKADGSLVVAADVEFPPGDGGVKVIDQGTLQGYEDLQQWAAKFSQLHCDEASSDCSIQIGGISIPAHKPFLMAQSPIFRSMFTHQEAEEFQSGVVKVTDFKEPEPMRALVRYCYQGQLDTETMDVEGAVGIFKLADRYCIAGLKALLEQHFVIKTLSVENVVAMAVLADTYSASKLKEACIELIAEEGDAIFESADWKELREAHSKLTTDLAIAAYRHMK